MKNGNDWVLKYDDFVPEKQKLREALCTLGNGYFCTRGAFSEVSADEDNYPGTYLAGGYNRLETEMVGRIIENEDLVNMPNWLPLTFRIEDGEWFHLRAVEILSFEQNLNLKNGTLSRKIRFRDAHGRECTLKDMRLVHLKDYHLAAIQWSLKGENWSGKLEIRSALDGQVINDGVSRYRELNSVHLEPLESGLTDENTIYIKVKTNQSEIQIAQAARTKILQNGEIVAVEPETYVNGGYAEQCFSIDIAEGDKVTAEKIIAVYTSRDHATAECSLEAKNALIDAPNFSQLLETQTNAWKMYWGQFDIEIETTEVHEARYPLLILRVHIFHLLQTVSMNTIELDVGVPARGWHGEAYRGHIFWDELFIFPILNLRIPKITAALLKYRYRRLNEARKNAKKSGFKGAMFPWQSGSNGREESQQVHLNPKSGRWIPDHSFIQRHVNVAIAYNVWRYYEVTEDLDFLRSYGAEMLVEISRFLVSLCTYNEDLDRYEIHHVMGPDEYHDAYPGSETPGLNNNAYTNVMTVWVLSRTLEALEVLPYDHHQELRAILNLSDQETEKWQELTEKMRVVFHGEGIISQFEGYEKLEEFRWDDYRKKYGDIQRLDRILEAEGDTPNRYKLSKQADALMLFYLFSAEELHQIFAKLGYEFDQGNIPNIIDYYLKRTSHGSTLSRIVHSWVLSREDRPASWNLFIHALESDVADIQGGTTPEGIHLGAMAGTIDLVQRCYTGIETRGDVLWFNPCLPDDLKRLRYHIHYRGHSIEVEVTHQRLKILARYTTARKIHVGFHNQTYPLTAGDVLEFNLNTLKSAT